MLSQLCLVVGGVLLAYATLFTALSVAYNKGHSALRLDPGLVLLIIAWFTAGGILHYVG